jgi:hypothetical protein
MDCYHFHTVWQAFYDDLELLSHELAGQDESFEIDKKPLFEQM